ncbi:MAG: RHS repeat-associated core domain-containing protein [Luteimonas sp.]
MSAVLATARPRRIKATHRRRRRIASGQSVQRYYDPQIGRFDSRDPAESEFNRYNYASNNPYRFTDPDGRVAGLAKKFGELIDDAKGIAQAAVRGLGLDANSENSNNRSAAQEMAKPVEAEVVKVQVVAKAVQTKAENGAKVGDKAGLASDATAVTFASAPVVAEVAVAAGRVAHGVAFALDATPERAASLAVGPLAKGAKLLTGEKAAQVSVEGADVLNEGANQWSEHQQESK